ncbi:hypothetical protein [Streptomyces sp. NPDC051098]|uniref:hypothetical protein n=1 Tax=Streptomyces sp. NPDC051098 TaxID=3155411 RepID=UPI00342293A4
MAGRTAAATGLLSAAGLPASAAQATLGDVLRGDHPGRASATDRSGYAPVGLPRQDLAMAWAAYQQGQTIDLLS